MRIKLPIVIIGLYLMAVLLCLLRAFDYAGAINIEWTLVVIGLTLPWSLVSVLFTWSLIHGAGLEFFTFMYLLFAVVNSLLFYRLYSFLQRRATRLESNVKAK